MPFRSIWQSQQAMLEPRRRWQPADPEQYFLRILTSLSQTQYTLVMQRCDQVNGQAAVSFYHGSLSILPALYKPARSVRNCSAATWEKSMARGQNNGSREIQCSLRLAFLPSILTRHASVEIQTSHYDICRDIEKLSYRHSYSTL